MAVHAHAGRGNPGMAAGAGCRVAIEAGNLVVSGMNFVWKGDRLGRRITLVQADLRQLPGAASSGEDQDKETEEYEFPAHRFLVFLRPEPSLWVTSLDPCLARASGCDKWAGQQTNA